MLASDRSVSRAGRRRRAAARTCDGDLWEQAQFFDPIAPWDRLSAEALTRLYESEEGRLSRPAAGDRARPMPPQAVVKTTETVTESAIEPAEAVDRRWMEEHLSGLAQRLQETLAQANPEPSLAALNGRLETIEQRFGATLGRVAQRADLEGLRSIESRVLDLAGQLEQARERLDRIGTADDEVRTLARKVEEAGAQRTSGLEKLLRDCIAEWREGEQRTAAALQSIEESLTRLGEAVDAMEASKPAPDLTVPPLTSSELDLMPGAAGVRFQGVDDRVSVPALYQPMLDAADYAPRSFRGTTASASATLPVVPARTGDDMEWSGEDSAGDGPGRAKLTPGALRIMALREKLRQSNGVGRGALPTYMSAAAMADPRDGAIRRASLSVLLMAGAAFVAGSTYLLYHSFLMAAPVKPAMTAPGAAPAGAQSDLAGPHGKGAS